MAKDASDAIRNIALIGHADSGKTTLADTLLKVGGTVPKAGRVDDGTSLSDFDEQERDRKHSIYAAVLHTDWKGRRIYVLDTPGYPDFNGEVVTELSAADTAVLCVSAAAGVGVNTRRTWEIAGEYGLPRAILITKIDSDSAKYAEVLAQVQETFGRNCVPVLAPEKPGPSVAGVTSLLAPDAEGRQELIEAVAESDDALMEKYLEDQELTEDEIAAAFVKAVAEGTVVPVLCCSAEKEIGVDQVLDVITTYFPGPSRRANLPPHKPGEADEPAEVPEPDGPFSAFVFKILTDPFVGKIAFFRVVSGTTDASGFTIVRTGNRARVNALLRPQGKEQEPVDELVAGDIGTVAKIEEIGLGDTLTDSGAQVEFGPFPLPTPMVALAVSPKSRGDEGRLSTSLQKLADEDPAFRYDRDRQTKELVIRGMSALHLDILLARLKRRYNVEVDTKVPEIPYLETITAQAEGHYRHKKQTGGRGQFGEVYLRAEPNERGVGLEFIDEIVGGAIPKQFLPAIEKGVREAMAGGVIAGYEVVDVKVAVHDGSFHTVDSDEASFKIAGSRAFADAVSSAKPVLLEPICTFEISVPSRYMGDVTSDLSGRRARISDTGVVGDTQIISGEVPLAEVQTYSTELRSMTGGEGSYSIEFARYDIVPSNLQQQIVAKAQAKKKEG
jgi:elongation factor G